jgi:hypothetical protein
MDRSDPAAQWTIQQFRQAAACSPFTSLARVARCQFQPKMKYLRITGPARPFHPTRLGMGIAPDVDESLCSYTSRGVRGRAPEPS